MRSSMVGWWGYLFPQAALFLGPRVFFPRVYALQHGGLVRGTRSAPAEFVRVFQLLKELHGVVDAVDAELQGIYVPGIQRDGGFASHAEGAPRTEREIGLVLDRKSVV